MAAQVIKNGKTTNVKNLAWLVKNHRQITDFEISKGTDNYECVIQANFCDGYYSSDFASYEVLKEWLARPIFRGLQVVDNIAQKTYIIEKISK